MPPNKSGQINCIVAIPTSRVNNQITRLHNLKWSSTNFVASVSLLCVPQCIWDGGMESTEDSQTWPKKSHSSSSRQVGLHPHAEEELAAFMIICGFRHDQTSHLGTPTQSPSVSCDLREVDMLSLSLSFCWAAHTLVQASLATSVSFNCPLGRRLTCPSKIPLEDPGELLIRTLDRYFTFESSMPVWSLQNFMVSKHLNDNKFLGTKNHKHCGKLSS